MTQFGVCEIVSKDFWYVIFLLIVSKIDPSVNFNASTYTLFCKEMTYKFMQDFSLNVLFFVLLTFVTYYVRLYKSRLWKISLKISVLAISRSSLASLTIFTGYFPANAGFLRTAFLKKHLLSLLLIGVKFTLNNFYADAM